MPEDPCLGGERDDGAAPGQEQAACLSAPARDSRRRRRTESWTELGFIAARRRGAQCLAMPAAAATAAKTTEAAGAAATVAAMAAAAAVPSACVGRESLVRWGEGSGSESSGGGGSSGSGGGGGRGGERRLRTEWVGWEGAVRAEVPCTKQSL